MHENFHCSNDFCHFGCEREWNEILIRNRISDASVPASPALPANARRLPHSEFPVFLARDDVTVARIVFHFIRPRINKDGKV